VTFGLFARGEPTVNGDKVDNVGAMQNPPIRRFLHVSARDLFGLLITIVFGVLVFVLRWHYQQ
jgi:hypothetical protein